METVGQRTLADLGKGERGIIATLTGADSPAVTRRLFDLGLVPGAEVTLLRRSPLADPAIYRVADYDIALRRHEAARVILADPA